MLQWISLAQCDDLVLPTAVDVSIGHANTDIRVTRPAVCRKYDHGGVSGVHCYACCNNCNGDDRSCDGDTSQGGGTTDSLCSTCVDRIPSQGTPRHTYTFNCGSCSQQRQYRDCCNDQHPYAKSVPGLCPKWMGCFRACCLSHHSGEMIYSS